MSFRSTSLRWHSYYCFHIRKHECLCSHMDTFTFINNPLFWTVGILFCESKNTNLGSKMFGFQDRVYWKVWSAVCWSVWGRCTLVYGLLCVSQHCDGRSGRAAVSPYSGGEQTSCGGPFFHKDTVVVRNIVMQGLECRDGFSPFLV